jgi:ribosomal-protein-alanine N-acetyltransferase
VAKVTVRKMCRTDLSTVSELALLANPHAMKEKYSKHLAEELEKNADLSFVSIEEGKILGYAQADACKDFAILEDIAVSNEDQGKGVGTLLLKKTMEVLKKKKAKNVFAEVHYKCARAIPFYYRHGFRFVGFAHDYFGSGHDAIILGSNLE